MTVEKVCDFNLAGSGNHQLTTEDMICAPALNTSNKWHDGGGRNNQANNDVTHPG